MALLTAREAAKRLNKDERTIRRWITAGKLTPKQSASNRLAIDERDIDALAASLTADEEKKRQEVVSMQARIEALEAEQARILARLALLETGKAARPDTDQIATRPATIRPARPRSAAAALPAGELPTDVEIPPGSRQATEFAAAHNINRVTFRDHLTLGIRGELVEHISFINPSNPRETKRYLSPEQQLAAREFWKRNRSPWRPCEDPGCLICNESGQEAQTNVLE